MISDMISSKAAADNVFIFVLVISLVLLIGITVTMIYFVFKYSRKKNPSPKNIESNLLLETVWVVVPTIIVLAMFYYGWSGFRFMRTVPDDVMEVKATGRMYSWQFEYDNGRKESALTVPLGQPVKLLITSQDVLHSLYIPAFRIKEDAVPGMNTYLWFLPDRIGEYDLFCSEYCGVKHAAMVTKVRVISGDDFTAWYGEGKMEETQAKKPALPPGPELLDEKGCLGCHSTDGTRIVGPSFKGIWGRQTVVLTGGKEREVSADEGYVRDAILNPGMDVVKDYPDIMPPQGDDLTEEELLAIIEYLKGLK